MRVQFLSVLIIGLVFTCHLAGHGFAEEVEQEYVTTTPVLHDGVLYVASSGYPSGRGHLRAIDVLDTIAVTLWDAADKVPLAGDDVAQPETIALENATRSLLTNIDGTLQPLDAASAAVLQGPLNVDSVVEAEMLVHALRGRRGGDLFAPAGSGEEPQRLGNFSRSSPLMVANSAVSTAMASRGRVLYIGADDGLLHAFFVSRINPENGEYPVDDPDGGTELWGYLPGSFLACLQEQLTTEPGGELTFRLDGSPRAQEVFADLDGNGLRRWHTLLAATGTILPQRISVVFVLDVTDPYQPALLWEQSLPGEGTGRTRGLVLGRCEASGTGCLYLSADSRNTDVNGLHALALSLDDGELLWQFSAPYGEQGSAAEGSPARPVLTVLDNDSKDDSLVLGDLLGRLWLLDAVTGEARGGAPVFTTPGGSAEPIVTEVAIRKNTVVFATGNDEAADSGGESMLYAIEILPDGGRLLWSYAFLSAERAWAAPRFDALGNLMLATAKGFRATGDAGAEPTSGRVVVLTRDGEELASRDTYAATVGGVVTAPGVVLSVDLTGEVTQFGTPARLSGPSINGGSVKLLSWRQR